MKRRTWTLFAGSLVAPGFVHYVQACAEGERLFDNEYMKNGPRVFPKTRSGSQHSIWEQPGRPSLPGRILSGWLLGYQGVLGEMPLLRPELEAAFEGLKDLGYPANLERILDLKPDLILTTSDAVDVAAAAERSRQSS